MPEPHIVMVVASVAAASSLVSFAAAAYLLPLWKNKGSEYSLNTANRRLPAAKTPEPYSSNAVQTGALFSPVNKQKRPDPYDSNPRSTYLSWDDYFMALAFLSAERSKDPNKQVGACIVNDKNIILSIGYNGFPRGCADSALPWSKRAASGSILDTKYPYVVHAEANALLNKNQAHVTGARIYVTLFPCNECAKLLIQAGIKEVIFHEAKLEPTGQRPATMERAAAADAAVDRLEEAAAAAAAAAAAQAAAGQPGTSSEDTIGSNSTSGAADACINCKCQAVGQAEGLSVGGEQAGPNHHHHHQQQQRSEQEQGSTQKKKFGVGSSDDVDASYAASQRLLMLAGVKLRQHRLQRSIQLGPG